MVSTVFLLGFDRKLLDRKTLKFLSDIEERSVKEFYQEKLAIKKLLKFKDEDLNSAILNFTPKPQVLKKHSLHFLKANITSLNLFTPEFQRKMLEINSTLSYINEDIDFAAGKLEKTFEQSLGINNRKIVMADLESAYKNIVMQGLRLLRAIEEIID